MLHEPLVPVLRHKNMLLILLFLNDCVPLVQSMPQDLLQLIMQRGIQDVKEVLLIYSSTNWQRVREVLLAFLSLAELRPHSFDADFFKAWPFNLSDFMVFQQGLLFLQDVPGECNGKLCIWQHVHFYHIVK